MPELRTEPAPAVRAPANLEDLASIMELPLLGPDLSGEQIEAGCGLARRLGLATVIVRHSDLDSAVNWTRPPVTLGCAVDWPHGHSSTAVKQYAVRDALRRGAREILVAMNASKLVSRQFQYLEMELVQLVEACKESGATLTVSLEMPHLNDEHKVVACRVAKRAGAARLGVGGDATFFAPYLQDRIQLTHRGAATLDEALAAYAAGCVRIEPENAAAILGEWSERVEAAAKPDGRTN